jgi:hypothetical protein
MNKPFTFALERTLQISLQKQGGWTREGEFCIWRVPIIPDADPGPVHSFRPGRGQVMIYDRN